jgi:2-polyprenyl-6-methoxyphenol hydroxylase-like FAD-dependent oxidoreductase
MPARPHCAIVGAGIGGLTLALALQQRGFTFEIFERAKILSEIGAGLLLSPNAVSILHALGLKDELASSSMVTPVWRVLDTRGRTLARIRPQHGETPAISLRRFDLQQILASRLHQKVRLDQEVIDARDTAPDRAEAFLSNGSSFTASLIVACDGIHSPLRQACFADSVERPFSYIGWRAVIDFVPHDWEDGTVTESWGRGMRFGLASVGHGRCYWYASANRGATNATERKALLLRLFSTWHSPVVDVISATPHDEILETPIAERPLPPRLHQGRVVLLGDAAHAMTPNLGQGAAMAIEDAWELAKCLENTDLASALKSYDRHRRTRVRLVQLASRLVGVAIQCESPSLAACRNRLLGLTPSIVAQAGVRWIFRPQV